MGLTGWNNLHGVNASCRELGNKKEPVLAWLDRVYGHQKINKKYTEIEEFEEVTLIDDEIHFPELEAIAEEVDAELEARRRRKESAKKAAEDRRKRAEEKKREKEEAEAKEEAEEEATRLTESLIDERARKISERVAKEKAENEGTRTTSGSVSDGKEGKGLKAMVRKRKKRASW